MEFLVEFDIRVPEGTPEAEVEQRMSAEAAALAGLSPRGAPGAAVAAAGRTKWRRVLIFGVFVIAGAANPSPDPVTMLILGGTCAVLVEAAEVIVWAHDRRRARLHPDPYAGLADDELSPLSSGGRGRG